VRSRRPATAPRPSPAVPSEGSGPRPASADAPSSSDRDRAERGPRRTSRRGRFPCDASRRRQRFDPGPAGRSGGSSGTGSGPDAGATSRRGGGAGGSGWSAAAATAYAAPTDRLDHTRLRPRRSSRVTTCFVLPLKATPVPGQREIYKSGTTFPDPFDPAGPGPPAARPAGDRRPPTYWGGDPQHTPFLVDCPAPKGFLGGPRRHLEESSRRAPDWGRAGRTCG
jgi:hypothetical protein